MCTWAQVFRKDFSVRDAAQSGLQDQLVDSVDEGCFHYYTLLQTLHVWRTRIVIQIPHCPICPVCSASYPRTCFQFLHKAAACCCQSHHFPVTRNIQCFRIWYLILSILVYQVGFSSVLFLAIHQTMVVTDSCVFLMVLLLLIEVTWHTVLHPSHPNRCWVCLPFSGCFLPHGIWHLPCNLHMSQWGPPWCPAISDMKCFWWVAMAGKITIFVLWALHWPKWQPLHMPFCVVIVAWCRSCQEECWAEMRQIFLISPTVWEFHISFILQFVLPWSHTHSWCI